MAENMLAKIFEHNNWANSLIIEACAALTDDQLDAEPQSVTKGSIRITLNHLVNSQHGYLSLLTLPVEERQRISPAFNELKEAARKSGEGLVALVRNDPDKHLQTRLQTTDGFYVEPWIVLIQIINHATEHREQICSMLNMLGVAPPYMDGWSYGEATDTLIAIDK